MRPAGPAGAAEVVVVAGMVTVEDGIAAR